MSACSACSADVAEATRFCPSCGTPVDDASATPTGNRGFLLARALAPWFLAGLLLGSQLGFWTARLNEIGGFSPDGLMLAAFTGLTYAAAGLAIGTVVLLALRSLSSLRPVSEMWDPQLHAALACAIAGLVAFRGVVRVPGEGLPTVLALAVAGVSGVLFGRVLASARPGAMAVLLAALVAGAAATGQTQARSPKAELPVSALREDVSTPPVILIGLDGFDPVVAEKLMRRGQLPRLQELARRGAYGRIHTLTPTYSPAIWTTIATGQLPRKHGIHEFEAYAVSGLNRPIQGFPKNAGFGRLLTLLARYGRAERVLVTTSLRRTAALWNIVSEAGGRVALLNWWPSWPVERLNGIVVSDRFWHRAVQPGALARSSNEATTLPGQLEDDLRDLVVRPNQVPRRLTESLARALGRLSAHKGSIPPEAASTLRADIEILASDLTHESVARRLLGSEAFQFFAVYFRAIDSISHFGRKVSAELGVETDQESRQLIEQAIHSYYKVVDERIGVLADLAGQTANIVVCSDHGFAWAQPGIGDHNAAPPAFLVLSGPNIRPGVVIQDAGVVDLAPTLLYLLGLPSARDMDGKLLAEAIRPEVLAGRPPRAIDTYGARRADAPVSSDLDERLRENLRALGYVAR